MPVITSFIVTLFVKRSYGTFTLLSCFENVNIGLLHNCTHFATKDTEPNICKM